MGRKPDFGFDEWIIRTWVYLNKFVPHCLPKVCLSEKAAWDYCPHVKVL